MAALLTAVADKVKQSVASVSSSVLPFPLDPLNRLIFELFVVMTLAHLGLKVKVIGQGQRLELKLSID